MPSNSHLRQRTSAAVQSLMFYDSVQEDGRVAQPGPFRKAAVRMNQALVEHGHAAPWVHSREQLHDLWSSDVNTVEEAGNKPEDFSAKTGETAQFMDAFWRPYVTPDDEIVELGCNAGPNLRGLLDLGYKKLNGVDINPHAIEVMREQSPKLAKTAKITIGPFEEVLGAMPSDSVDVVYSTTVLHHVHPTSIDIFAEIVRVARKHVFVLEDEHAVNSYHFPRNYRRLFERYGCVQLRSALVTPQIFPDVPYPGCTARLLRVP